MAAGAARVTKAAEMEIIGLEFAENAGVDFDMDAAARCGEGELVGGARVELTASEVELDDVEEVLSAGTEAELERLPEPLGVCVGDRLFSICASREE